MENMTKTLYDVVQYVLGFGPTVMLPLVLFVLALIFKNKTGKSAPLFSHSRDRFCRDLCNF